MQGEQPGERWWVKKTARDWETDEIAFERIVSGPYSSETNALIDAGVWRRSLPHTNPIYAKQRRYFYTAITDEQMREVAFN